VVRFRYSYNQCKIVGRDDFFLSVGLCIGILRVSILFVGFNDFGVGEDAAGDGLD